MPTQRIVGVDAYRNLRRNPQMGWPGNNARGAARLGAVALPEQRSNFRLIDGEAIFTVGSCFARNVERHLEMFNYDLPVRAWDRYKKASGDGNVPNEFINKYVVPSIELEMRWALSKPDCFPGDRAYVSAGDLWFDPHAAPAVAPASLEVLRTRRDIVRGIYQQIPTCRVFIMTLGLVEAWWDAELQIYLNSAPPAETVKASSGRFELHVLSYDQILESLFAIRDLFDTHGPPGGKILVTVSPVPLVATMTTDDVLVANSYSKAVQRAAAEEFRQKSDNVDYFPSYESVTLSERRVAFEDDNRHVQRDIVGVNIGRMIAKYAPDRSNEADAYVQESLALILERRGDLDEAAKHAETAIEFSPRNSKLLLLGGRLNIRRRRWADAKALLDRAMEVGPEPATHFWLGIAARALGQTAEAVSAFKRAIEQNPSWAVPYYHMALTVQASDTKAAQAWAQRAVTLKADFSDAVRLLGELSKAPAS